MRHPLVIMSWLVWASLLFSVGIYSGLVVSGVISRPENAPDAVLVNILLGVAGFNALLTFIMRFFLRRFIRRENLQPRPNWAGRYLPLAIVIWALSEAIAIFGLVLFLIGASAMTYWTFAGLSMGVLVCHMPAFLIPKDKKAAEALGPMK